MSRVHGCTRATLGTSFFGQAKKKCLAAKRRKQFLKKNKDAQIDWIPAQGRYDDFLNYHIRGNNG